MSRTELAVVEHTAATTNGGSGHDRRDAHMIRLDEAAELAEMFHLLGDPTRVRILYTLLELDELCVRDLADAVGVSETNVSQALGLLRSAGVVRNRRDGRHVRYRLDDAHVRLLLDLTREHLAHRGSEIHELR